MKLYYEGSDGTVIDFMKWPLAAQNPETLLENGWKYTSTTSMSGIGKIRTFYKDIQKRELDISIMADSEEEFNQIMYRMHRTFEKDVRTMHPGKIWWNDFYMECFFIDASYSEFEELFTAVEKRLTMISPYQYWRREKKLQFLPYASAGGGIDYPYDFLYDYGQSEFIEIIENDFIDTANFEMVFYGPCRNPYITIAGRVYGLYTDLEEGEYAKINSITKKIKHFTAKGEESNLFHTRNRDSYIFEKIPTGTNPVVRQREQAVDVIIFDERGEPVWI